MDVFINKVSKFLPNSPIGNDEMENVLGMINDKPSRARSIVLRQNGIKQRYYSLFPNQKINTKSTELKISHTNAELAAEAIQRLFDSNVKLENVQLLCCGTSAPDQFLPSHTSMVHGILKGHALEIVSPSGVCLSSAHAMKVAYMAIKSGESCCAVCSGSEMVSPGFHASKYEAECAKTEEIEGNPYIAFDKDFLRFMLSDGAGAALLENKKRGNISLKIEWIESVSYANKNETCMYLGGEKLPNGELKSWKVMRGQEWLDKSIFAIRQDFKLLGKEVIGCWIEHLTTSFKKHDIDTFESIDYFVPHFSSMFFGNKLKEEMKENGIEIPYEKWFFNLPEIGNVGSASIYIALEELFNSGKLIKGERIILAIPESGRFSYMTASLKVT
ncbi:MAG: hypothetical protein BGO29_03930 [Bacteroidales bacterium 36-12]|nr:MAG: hypothetical protein BGO29_03930 [Bacteroidales bacterium 36-12]